MEIIFLIVGIFVGWLIRHLRAARCATEQSSLFSKLSAETREVILADPRERLTTVELVRLIDERIFEPIRQEALPYITCPNCGSKDVTTQDHDKGAGAGWARALIGDDPDSPTDKGTYYTIHCNACNRGNETSAPA